MEGRSNRHRRAESRQAPDALDWLCGGLQYLARSIDAGAPIRRPEQSTRSRRESRISKDESLVSARGLATRHCSARKPNSHRPIEERLSSPMPLARRACGGGPFVGSARRRRSRPIRSGPVGGRTRIEARRPPDTHAPPQRALVHRRYSASLASLSLRRRRRAAPDLSGSGWWASVYVTERGSVVPSRLRRPRLPSNAHNPHTYPTVGVIATLTDCDGAMGATQAR
jgi:hypothetical protein